MSRDNASIVRGLAWIALATVALAGGLLGIGWLPTRAVAGAGSFAAMACGIAIAAVAMLAGLIPGLLARGSGPRALGSALFAGTAVRFLLTLALLGAALLGGIQPRAVLAIWAALAYVVLLVVETAGLVRLSRGAPRSHA